MEKVIRIATIIMILAISSLCAYYVGEGILDWVRRAKLLTSWGNAAKSFGIHTGMIILSAYVTILFTPKRE
ncbi:hypothetical protein F400_gp112 [Bacillus phage BCD7]|uniref:Uncharacterized protein n=1 Tax=Bacillus phage BCD7 TaxID=1136534 RepID=J9PVA3_9CAUD|nr:hypothetical protein F400_gp112 [Bacillus phage BCD7]AEZ50559.1 hypothetical protein BCD7_0112 [Bacillus phage BCD7]